MKYAVAIVVPEPVNGALSALQQNYALPPWKPRFPLHITLVTPFDTHESADAVAVLLGAAAARPPFSVELDGLGRFDNEESVLYAHVVPGPELVALADATLAAVSSLRRGRSRPWVPHATLANAAPSEVIDGYMVRMADEPVQHTFTCDNFSLLRLSDERRSTEASRPNVQLDEKARMWHAVRTLLFT